MCNNGRSHSDIGCSGIGKGSGGENDIQFGRLDKKYGTPALLKGCEKGTLSLNDANILVDELDQNVNAYLKDTEGNKSLTYLLAYNSGNDKDDVLTKFCCLTITKRFNS